MRAKTKRAGGWMVGLLVATGLITACAPAGPRALLKGKDLLAAGKPEAAVAKLQTAVSLMPTNAAAWNYLGLAWHRSGQWTNAAEAYSRAIRLDRELMEARFNLGCLYLDQNQIEPAKTEFTAFTLRRENSMEGWLKLGATQLRGREAAAAERSYRQALRISTTNAEALNGLGLALLQRNRAREAVDAFAEALKQQADYQPALLNLATVSQQQLNDRAEALRRYREYLALKPRPENWEAVNAIVQALETPSAPSRPSTNGAPTVTTNLAVAIPRSGPATNPPRVVPAVVTRPAPSSEVTRPATAPAGTAPPLEVAKVPAEPTIKPAAQPERPPAPASSPSTSAPAAVVASKPAAVPVEQSVPPVRRSPPDTKTASLSAPAVAPSATEGANRVGAAARLDAETPLPAGRYVYLSPKPAAPGNRREAEQAFMQGQHFQRADRLSESLQTYRRATLLDPAYFEAHYQLGLVAYSARSFRVALTAWENALALRPDNADVRYNFALTLKAANYPQDAANELEKLLSLHPDEARGHLTLGNLYAEQRRDITRARRHYQRVLQLDPRNPQAQAIRYWLAANPG